MLTESDIEFIKRNRTELTQNRTDSVILLRKVYGEPDPFTGDREITTEPVTVQATWARQTGDADITTVDGVQVESGDVIANFDIAELSASVVDLSEVETVKHDGESYAIKAKDTVGLGEDNRYFVLLRKVT